MMVSRKIFIGPLINHYERFSLASGANDVLVIKDATTYVWQIAFDIHNNKCVSSGIKIDNSIFCSIKLNNSVYHSILNRKSYSKKIFFEDNFSYHLYLFLVH